MGTVTDKQRHEPESYTGRVKYTDSMAEHYLKKSEGRRGRENATLIQILDRFEVRGPLLDAPCGVGRVGALLDGSGIRYFGADFSVPMLLKARERLGQRDLSHKLLRCDLEHASFGSRVFDTTLSLRFLHHLPTQTRSRVLRELARITDRLLIVTFFHPFALHYLERSFLGIARKMVGGEPSNRYSNTTGWLAKQMNPEGLKLVAVYGTGFLRETRYAVFERI